MGNLGNRAGHPPGETIGKDTPDDKGTSTEQEVDEYKTVDRILKASGIVRELYYPAHIGTIFWVFQIDKQVPGFPVIYRVIYLHGLPVSNHLPEI
jgi:hypothetical protein